MPYSHVDMKRDYMKSYVAQHPERMCMYRKREIIRRAQQQSRLPSKRSIARYRITAEELAELMQPILHAAPTKAEMPCGAA